MTVFRHPVVLALGWTLLHILWQGALVGAATALMLSLLRHASAQARYLAACVGLMACLIAPAATLMRLWPPSAPSVIQIPTPTVSAWIAPDVNPQSTSPSLTSRMEHLLIPALPWIVGGWSLGAVLCLLRLLGGWAWLRRLRRQGSHSAPSEWQERLADLAKRMRLGRCPELQVCLGVEGPLAYGWWRPAVLVPASLLTGMNPDLLEALLAHELAHIQRQDYLVNLLQSLSETLLFFHPAIWWISAKIRSTREEACDDLAAMAIGEPRRLALALAELDLIQFPEPAPSLALGAHQGNLMTRITRLLNPAQPRPILGGLVPLLLAVSLLSPMMASSAPPIETIRTETLLRPAHLVAQLDALAAKEGIDPDLLRALAEIESQYNPEAVSRLGSLGLLQVLPETARKYGAKDLSDPAQVAAAGAHYLKFLLNRYNGDWAKAVAAYNGGEEALDAGKLSEETRRYVPAVLRLAQSSAVQADGDITEIRAIAGDRVVQGPVTEKSLLKVPKGDPTAQRHIFMARRDGLLTLDLGVTRQELLALLAENWNWLFAEGVEDRELKYTLPPTTSGEESGIKIELKQADPKKFLQNLAKIGYLPVPLSEAWLKQLPPGTASGELKPLSGDEWDVRMQVLALDGFEVEFRVEGQAKPAAHISVGAEPSQHGLLRTISQPHIRTEAIHSKRVIIRAMEVGTGRWGETVVDLSQGSANFRVLIDKERKNP